MVEICCVKSSQEVIVFSWYDFVVTCLWGTILCGLIKLKVALLHQKLAWILVFIVTGKAFDTNNW